MLCQKDPGAGKRQDRQTGLHFPISTLNMTLVAVQLEFFYMSQLFFFTPWQHSIDSKNMTCNLKDAQLPRDVQWVNKLWGFCQLCWGEDFWSQRHSRGHPMERRLAGPRCHLWRLQRGKPVWHQKLDRRVTLDLRGSFLDQLLLFILCLHFLGIFINIYRNQLYQ